MCPAWTVRTAPPPLAAAAAAGGSCAAGSPQVRSQLACCCCCKSLGASLHAPMLLVAPPVLPLLHSLSAAVKAAATAARTHSPPPIHPLARSWASGGPSCQRMRCSAAPPTLGRAPALSGWGTSCWRGSPSLSRSWAGPSPGAGCAAAAAVCRCCVLAGAGASCGERGSWYACCTAAARRRCHTAVVDAGAAPVAAR